MKKNIKKSKKPKKTKKKDDSKLLLNKAMYEAFGFGQPPMFDIRSVKYIP